MPGHFIKKYTQHKIEYKDYMKDGGDREKKKDQVPEIFNRKVAANKVLSMLLQFRETPPMN